MTSCGYWINLFTGTTWQEFLDAGGEVTGFRESRWASAQRIKKGDYLLCYLTGVSRFVGILEVTGPVFRDATVIWKDENFPCRIPVKVVHALMPETAIPVFELENSLSFLKDAESRRGWTGRFRGSPVRWGEDDGVAVISAVAEAADHPIHRPVDPAKLARRPTALRTKIGSVTVPEADEPRVVDKAAGRESTAHTEIQWILLKLGSDMGLDVWVARNDKGREYNGSSFAKIPGIKSELPLQFDEATNRTIELIDVLWLRGNAIVAAFEIESTTSIYSGLLRMGDLIAMQPNLNIPLYLVAPDERREKVILEVNRPTFSRLQPPMSDMCRFVPFEALKKQIALVEPVVKYLKPEFLVEFSESCEVEEA